MAAWRARPPQAAGEVKYGYVIVTAMVKMVDSQLDVTRLVQLPNFFHPGQQQTA